MHLVSDVMCDRKLGTVSRQTCTTRVVEGQAVGAGRLWYDLPRCMWLALPYSMSVICWTMWPNS